MSVAINSSPAGVVNNRQGSWKRRGSDNEDERQDLKKAKFSWYVRLESESPVPTDEDDESIYTVQGNETEFARDTSDTSAHSWVSSNESEVSVHVEYELDSESENDNPYMDTSSGSEPENILAVQFITFYDSEGLADDSDDSRSSIDSEIRRADFWTCVQCKNRNNNPLFRYCEKCYQVRRTHFLRNRPRRKPRALKDENNKSKTKVKIAASISSNQELSEMDSGLVLSPSEMDSAIGSSQDLDRPASDSQVSERPTPDSHNSEKNAETTSSTIVSSQSLGTDETDLGPGQKKYDSDSPSSPDSGNSGSSHAKAISGESQSESGCNNEDASSLMTMLSKKLQSQREENGKVMVSLPKTETENEQQTQGSDSLCLICTVSPRNGSFVHGRTEHKCCCYRCSMKVWMTNGNRCPICSRRVTQVVRTFSV